MEEGTNNFSRLNDVSERQIWPGKPPIESKYPYSVSITDKIMNNTHTTHIHVHVRMYNTIDDHVCYLLFSSEGIPSDGIHGMEIVSVAIPLTVAYSTVSAFGLCFAVCCLVFNFVYRKKK